MPTLSENGQTLTELDEISSLYLETFTIRVLTETSDGQGGTGDAFADGATFSGRLSRPGSSRMAEVIASEKETVEISHAIYCPPATAVAEENRITLGTRTFLVQKVVKPSNMDDADWTGAHLEILVLEVDGDL